MASGVEFFSHPWLNEGAIEKREYQERILEAALKGNLLCVLPTGTGKTAIAALVAAMRLEKFPDSKILFLAPTKPLAKQHRDSFERFLKIGPDELRVVTGETSPEERSEEYRKAWAVFATPQTIQNDIKNGTFVPKNFSLLIVDEAHRSIGNYAYTFVTKSYVRHADFPLILALTASPGSDVSKIEQIKNNLFIERVEIRSERDFDVSPYVKEVQRHWIKVDPLPEMKDISELLHSALERRLRFLIKFGHIRHTKVGKKVLLDLQSKLRREAIAKQDSSLFQAMSVAVQCIKISHAIELAETQTLETLRSYWEKLVKEGKKTKALRSILEDKEIQRAVEISEKLYSSGKDNAKLTKLIEILKHRLGGERKAIVFTQYVDTVGAIVRRINRSALSEAGVRAQPFIGQRKGVTQKKQMAVLQEFRRGEFNVLVATSIGEEGLDIPAVDVVVFYEPIPSEIRSIQRRGRTGRFREGELFVLIAKGTLDEAYYWSAHHKEKQMRAIMADMSEEQEQDFGRQRGQKSLGDFDAEDDVGSAEAETEAAAEAAGAEEPR